MVDDEVHHHFNDVLREMSAFLDGRRTYEMMAEFWPTADQRPESTVPMTEFADIWRETPKIVYSRTLETAEWNTTVVSEVIPEEVERLKAEPGGDMAIGGAELAATFFRHGLVDEVRLYFHPVILGDGKPLFPKDRRLDLERIASRVFGNGVTLLHYRVRR